MFDFDEEMFPDNEVFEVEAGELPVGEALTSVPGCPSDEAVTCDGEVP